MEKRRFRGGGKGRGVGGFFREVLSRWLDSGFLYERCFGAVKGKPRSSLGGSTFAGGYPPKMAQRFSFSFTIRPNMGHPQPKTNPYGQGEQNLGAGQQVSIYFSIGLPILGRFLFLSHIRKVGFLLVEQDLDVHPSRLATFVAPCRGHWTSNPSKQATPFYWGMPQRCVFVYVLGLAKNTEQTFLWALFLGCLRKHIYF